MRSFNSLFVASAMSLVAAASPNPGFAHGASGMHHAAHIIRLGGAVGAVKVVSGNSLGGVARSIHAQRNRNRNATAFAGLPWEWSYNSYAVVAPPAAPGIVPVMMRAPMPVAELPRCRESFGNVSIVRGKSCRT